MSSERERREFQAGLAEEVDAWLRGDKSRRTFLQRLCGAGRRHGAGATRPRAARDEPWRERGAGGGRAGRSEHAVWPGAGRRGQGVDRRSARELHVSRRRGSEAVRRLDHQHDLRVGPAGAGAPQLLRTAVAGPDRHRLQRRGAAAPDQYSKPIAEHIAGSGAFDILDIEPAWIPAMANGGVILPIDDYVEQHMDKADLEDFHPLYQFLPTYKGKRWGISTTATCSRSTTAPTSSATPNCSRRTRPSSTGTCACPRPGTSTPRSPSSSPISSRPTSTAPRTSARPATGNQFSFLQQYRANGGRFFDEQTMKAQLGRRPGSRPSSR